MSLGGSANSQSFQKFPPTRIGSIQESERSIQSDSSPVRLQAGRFPASLRLQTRSAHPSDTCDGTPCFATGVATPMPYHEACVGLEICRQQFVAVLQRAVSEIFRVRGRGFRGSLLSAPLICFIFPRCQPEPIFGAELTCPPRVGRFA